MTEIPAEASSEFIQFYDSALWPSAPPSTQYGLKYIDGEFAPDQRIRFEHTRFITVHGHYRDAGIIDFEPENPAFNPWTLRRFVRGRKALNLRARVYCDRVDATEALRYLAVDGLDNYPEWWIATLDGKQWTAAELAADLESHFDAPIPADRIWANQWTQVNDGEIDQSSLFGAW